VIERIVILGPCGSGKSTLAEELGARLGLPVIHLDREYWRPGWTEPAKPVWASQIEELIARPRWIMDGNYGGTLARRLQRAQLIVNLDYRRRVFLPRLIRRLIANFGRTRADMGEGCPERFDAEFWRYAWRYRIDVEPRRRAQFAASGVPLLGFHSPRETKAWLAAGAPVDEACDGEAAVRA
jgi:adenylate kinase family enzyme